VKRAGFAGDALTNQARVLVDQNAHESSRLIANFLNVEPCTENELTSIVSLKQIVEQTISLAVS
jgi:hypothetical protein